MANASKLSSGAWRTLAAKTINGKKIRKSFTVHPDECGGDSKKAKTLSERNAREWVLNTETDQIFTTVSTAIDLYIKDRSSVLSPSTIADYERMPKHFSALLPLDVNDVDSKTIQATINEMAMNKLNARTIKNRIFFLISALNYVGVDKRFKLRFPSQIKPNLAPPEPTEFKRLLEMATDEERLTIILAGLYTLRRGEIAGLCGEDLLWDLNSIYVHTSRVQDDKNEWVRRNMPKNLNSVRVIQIDPEIMALFPHVGPKEYVISMNPNEITKHFIRLRKKACVECRFHDLRKYAASIRAEMMPSKYVEKAGGWRKGSTVLSTIYDKPFKEKESEYSKKFNKAIVEEYGKEIFGS
jgi:integrase